MAEPQGFLHSKTGAPILLFAGIGLGLSAAILLAFQHFCRGSTADLCTMARTSPPWLMVSGIAAAPSALLTWYWRTAHQKEEMRLRRAELNDHEQERQARRMAEAELAAERQRSAFSKAIESLANSQDTGTSVYVDEVLRLGRDVALYAPQAITELARYIQRLGQMWRPGGADRPPHYYTAVHHALVAISEIKTVHSLLNGPSLRDAILPGLNMSGLNLRGVDLRGAIITNANICGTRFLGADLAGIKAAGAEFDETTEMDQLTQTLLRIGGACSSAEKARSEQRLIDEFSESLRSAEEDDHANLEESDDDDELPEEA